MGDAASSLVNRTKFSIFDFFSKNGAGEHWPGANFLTGTLPFSSVERRRFRFILEVPEKVSFSSNFELSKVNRVHKLQDIQSKAVSQRQFQGHC